MSLLAHWGRMKKRCSSRNPASQETTVDEEGKVVKDAQIDAVAATTSPPTLFREYLFSALSRQLGSCLFGLPARGPSRPLSRLVGSWVAALPSVILEVPSLSAWDCQRQHSARDPHSTPTSVFTLERASNLDTSTVSRAASGRGRPRSCRPDKAFNLEGDIERPPSAGRCNFRLSHRGRDRSCRPERGLHPRFRQSRILVTRHTVGR